MKNIWTTLENTEKEINELQEKLKIKKQKRKELLKKIENEKAKKRIEENEKMISTLEKKMGPLDEEKFQSILQNLPKQEE